MVLCAHIQASVSQLSPLLGFQLLVPALMNKVLECVTTLGQDYLLLRKGLLLSQLCPALAPGLELLQCFLETGNSRVTIPENAMHTHAILIQAFSLNACSVGQWSVPWHLYFR